jgi:hypothetical protein
MMLSRSTLDNHRSAGFALFAVLSFSLLAATVSIPFLTGARTRALVARNIVAELRGDMITRGLVQIAAARLFDLRHAPDFLMPRTVKCRIGETSVSFVFQDQGGLIDLNMAPKELLIIGFGALGFEPAIADRFADTVIEFRGTASKRTSIAPTPVRGGYKRAKFEAVSELVDFDRIEGSVVPLLTSVFTVHNGTGTVFVHLASEKIQEALKVIPETQAYFVVQGQAMSSPVSILVAISNPRYPTYQASAVIRGEEANTGHTFLSPITFEPTSELVPEAESPGSCDMFFGDKMLAVFNTLLVGK